MDNVIKEREKNWKKLFFEKLKKSKNERNFVDNVLSHHLIYLPKFRDVKTRLYQILSNLKLQISIVKNSRIDIAHKKEFKEIEESLNKLRKKIKNIK